MRIHSPQKESIITALIKAGFNSDRADEVADSILAAMPTADLLGTKIEAIITQQVTDATAELAREIGSNYEAKLVAARGSARKSSLFVGFLILVVGAGSAYTFWKTQTDEVAIVAHTKDRDDKLLLLIAGNDTSIKEDVKLVADNHKALRERVDKIVDGDHDGFADQDLCPDVRGDDHGCDLKELVKTCTDYTDLVETKAASAPDANDDEGTLDWVGCDGNIILHAKYKGQESTKLVIAGVAPTN